MSDQDQQLDDEPIVMVPWVPPKSNTWRDILRPVTIFQLLHADSSPFFEDRSLVIEGRGFATVTLVAHVTSVEINPAKAHCILEDGTGRIHADKNFDSLTQGHGLSAEAEEEETVQYQALEHTYVEILGIPRRDQLHRTRLEISFIHPVRGYYQVLYHSLNVIHSNMLTQRHIQPYNSESDRDFGSSEDMDIYVPVDDHSQAYQDGISIQHHISCTIPLATSHAVLPNTFSPQKHQPYATLEPLERTIMKYMYHHKNYHVLIANLAQAIQASCGCTELQFDVAIRALLSEAYLTSPLDDGHVIITPRHSENLPL